MRNHGAVTVGSSIGEAFVRMWYLEKACRTQLTVMQSGGAVCRPPRDVLAHTAKQFDNIPNPAGYSEWNAMVKWFAAKSLGVKGSHAPPPPPRSETVLAEQPIRATDSDLHTPLLPVAVRGRKYLVGASGTAGGALFPSYIPQSTAEFPLSFVFSSSAQSTTVSAPERINTLGKHIRQLIDKELPAAGAMLFKKMPNIHSASDFSALMTSIGYSQFDYSGEPFSS